jgi:hypothetical protein
MSPGFSVGMNEYFCPHCPQNPFSRVSGRSHFAQNRLCSGTFGSARIAFSGSVEGSSGTEINPAPKLRRVLREELRVDRRDPFAPRATGEDPVAVETGALIRAEGTVAFASAKPHTLQYPSS